jgi:hypothetical protein
MFDVAIYRKTQKGREEMQHRIHGLPPRLRKALIIIDGKASFGELREPLALLGDPTEIVGRLSDLGFVESDYDLPPMPEFPPRGDDWPDTVQIHSSR